MSAASNHQPDLEMDSVQRPPLDLGVVLVHGIGAQGRAETLREWTDPLVNGIQRRGARADVIRVSHGDVDSPAHAEIRLTLRDGQVQHWLVAEAWWADLVSQPTYAELLVWTLHTVPKAVVLHVVGKVVRDIARVAASTSVMTSVARAIWLALNLTLEALLLALAAPFVLLLQILVLLVGMLPSLSIRESLLALQRQLMQTLGDCQRLLDSPIQAGAIRGRLCDTLAWLHRCGPSATVVLAHSQGAAIAVDCLIGAKDDPREIRCPGEGEVGALITFGAATNKLRALREGHMHGAILLTLVAGLLAAAWGTSLLGRHAGTSSPFLERLAPAAAFLALSFGAFFAHLMVAGVLGASTRWAEGHQKAAGMLVRAAERQQKVVRPLLLVVAMALSVLPAIVFLILAALLRWYESIWWAATWATAVLPGYVAVFGIFTAISFRTWEPLHGLRWVDIFASHDPVPAGPTLATGAGAPESHEIHTFGSVLRDHTTYWRCDDVFISIVLFYLMQMSRAKWVASWTEAADAISAATAARESRVKVLRWARLAVAVGGGALLARSLWATEFVGGGLIERIAELPLVGAFERWLADGSGGFIVGLHFKMTVSIICALALVALAYLCIAAAWGAWNRWAIDQRRLGNPVSILPAYLLVGSSVLVAVGLATC